MRLRRRCVAVCVSAFGLAYLATCLILLQSLDFWKNNLSRLVQVRGYSPEKLDLAHQLLKSDCACEKADIRKLTTQRSDTQVVSVRAVAPDEATCRAIDNTRNSQNVSIQVSRLYASLQLHYHHMTFVHRGWIPDLLDVPRSWNYKAIDVYIVPFSHADPGWLYTYSKYYNDKVRKTLTLATKRLRLDPTLRFVWSEVVYLRQWYEEQNAQVQTDFRRLLIEKRFEILTGGWVMTDEAVTHYGAMLDQIIEGHQWLSQTLNYTVTNAWSIDAFGLSGTMPYLLRRSGVRNLLIQRVHYSIKHSLAVNKQLEFSWRQTWDPSSSTDLFTHLPPYLLYNTLHNCGPDPEICCQFDFDKKNCYNAREYYKPAAITADNVRQKAELLVEQLRRKSELFSHDKVLMLYGDDFRFYLNSEWDSLNTNLGQLMDFINAQPGLKAKLRFSTLGEYFTAVRSQFDRDVLPLPSLAGDFLSYTDRDDQCWSGYYTSRPLLKILTRILHQRLRSADILYSLAAAHSTRYPSDKTTELIQRLYGNVRNVHQTAGLLQHHDAITGTARRAVVSDYLSKAREGIKLANGVAESCVSYLVEKDTGHDTALNTDLFKTAEYQQRNFGYLRLSVIGAGDQVIAVFNPLPWRKEVFVEVKVPHPYVVVKDVNGALNPCQVLPVWLDNNRVDKTKYKVIFQTELKPLEITRFLVKSENKTSTQGCHISKVKVTSVFHHHDNSTVFDTSWKGVDDFALETSRLQAHFCGCTGLTKAVVTKDNLLLHQSEISFVKYGTGSWINPLEDRSGAYTFVPNGPAREIDVKRPEIMIVEGPLVNVVTTKLPMVTHQVSLYDTDGPAGAALHIENMAEISRYNNTELAMRIRSDVDSRDVFYTDVNSFQIQKRVRLPQYKTQGNYYPITSQIYVEDQLFRMSLLSTSSHGASSLHSGEVEVMLDRRLAQDDWRGLNEGVLDNTFTPSRFLLLWETRRTPIKQQGSSELGHASLLAHQMSLLLLNPPPVFLQQRAALLAVESLQLMSTELPSDVELINLQIVRSPSAGPSVEALLLLRRTAFDCEYLVTYDTLEVLVGKLSLDGMFLGLRVSSLTEVSLTDVHPMPSASGGDGIAMDTDLPLMEIKAFRLTLTIS